MSNEINKELAAIEAGAIAYLTAFGCADVAAVLATYADDGVLMAPGMPAAVGKTELAVVYPEVFATVGFSMAYDIKEVVQISDDWAFVRSATEGTETTKATGITVHTAYQELFLLRKSAAGTWLITRYCTSKITPVA